jgi:cyanate lyase
MPFTNSGPIKTYKDVVNYFESLALSHMAVHQFGSGMISDIDVQTNTKTPTQYPLVFLVHRSGEIDSGGRTTFRFSLIVADIAKNTETLEVNRLSDTHSILQDLISRIVLTSWDTVQMEVQTPIPTTPFVERFNNNLSGWAAEIDVIIKSPFNLCEAAFD